MEDQPSVDEGEITSDDDSQIIIDAEEFDTDATKKSPNHEWNEDDAMLDQLISSTLPAEPLESPPLPQRRISTRTKAPKVPLLVPGSNVPTSGPAPRRNVRDRWFYAPAIPQSSDVLNPMMLVSSSEALPESGEESITQALR